MPVGKYPLHWATTYDDVKNHLGNAYGYWTMHEKLREYLAPHVDFTLDANDCVITLAPEFYTNKIPDKKNWLITMFEGSIPDHYIEALNRADKLLVPSQYCKDLLEEHNVKPETFVFPLGISTDFKLKKKRKFPMKRPFRFLWVGAPNPRKGWEEIIFVWKNAMFDQIPDVELYLKTTRVGKKRKMHNVYLDGRNLSKKELVKLYHSADCFVFPTRGEGFGFTLAEAMRTGMPSIATGHSGHMDFFDDKVGYTIDWKWGESTIEQQRSKTRESMESHNIKVAMPDLEDLAAKMVYVFTNYDEALKKGKVASQRISSKFTWQRSAKIFTDIIREN